MLAVAVAAVTAFMDGETKLRVETQDICWVGAAVQRKFS